MNQGTYKPTKFLSLSTVDGENLVLYNSLTGALGAVPIRMADDVKGALRRGARHKAPLTGVLQELAAGGFLILEDVDEDSINHRQYLDKYTNDFLELTILPTEQCNFRCVYCYESFTRGTMTPELVEGIKRYVSSQRLRRFHLSWFGGEPLLAKDVVIELTQHFSHYCSINNIQFIAGMTTNGSLLYPEVAEELLPYGLRQFQITLDGLEKEHEQKRVAVDGQPSFSRIIENLRHLKTTNYPFVVHLRHSFDPSSLERLNEFIAMLRGEFGGDPRFVTLFQPIGKWGNQDDIDRQVCDHRTAARFILEGRRLAIEAGFRDALLVESFRPNGCTCYAANPRSLVIGSDGKVYECTVELDYHDRNIVGQLHPSGDLEFDWRKMALWVETNGREVGKKCQTCFFSPSCHGAVCPKQWMDDNDVTCPHEKIVIREALSLTVLESKLPDKPDVEHITLCTAG